MVDATDPDLKLLSAYDINLSSEKAAQQPEATQKGNKDSQKSSAMMDLEAKISVNKVINPTQMQL